MVKLSRLPLIVEYQPLIYSQQKSDIVTNSDQSPVYSETRQRELVFQYQCSSWENLTFSGETPQHSRSDLRSRSSSFDWERKAKIPKTFQEKQNTRPDRLMAACARAKNKVWMIARSTAAVWSSDHGHRYNDWCTSSRNIHSKKWQFSRKASHIFYHKKSLDSLTKYSFSFSFFSLLHDELPLKKRHHKSSHHWSLLTVPNLVFLDVTT